LLSLPIFGTIGNFPEIRFRLDEFDANLRFAKQAGAEGRDSREDFFFCGDVLQADQLAGNDWHRQQNQGAVGIYHQSAGSFCAALALVAMDYHLDMRLHAAASATEFGARWAIGSFGHK
jgi:hypothetical protein